MVMDDVLLIDNTHQDLSCTIQDLHKMQISMVPFCVFLVQTVSTLILCHNKLEV